MEATEFTTRITESLDTILAWAESTQAAQFISEQTPLVIQELLAWHFWRAVAYGCAAAIGLIMCLAVLSVLAWIGLKKVDWDNEDHTIPFTLISILGGIGAISGGFVAIVVGVLPNFTTVLQIHIAPRVYILEYLRSIL